MTPKALEALEVAIRQHIPGFEVRYKEASSFMKFLGQLTSLFNPRFMSEFTTTWGSTVYFPSRILYLVSPQASFITLAHEFVHLWDGKEHGWRFRFSYATPQIYALAPLFLHAVIGSIWPLLVLLGCYAVASSMARRTATLAWGVLVLGVLAALVLSLFFTGLYTFLLLAGVILLGPWPSKSRTQWELRGYGMNVALYTWFRGSAVEDLVIDGITKQFTGPSYWYMSRDAEHVRSSLRATGMGALGGNLVETPYRVVHEILVEHGFVGRT